MIYITGDTHIPIDIHKFSSKNFSIQKELSKEDIVIICGDFGGVFACDNEEKYWLKWLGKKNFTTLFIDGNHDNHIALNNNYVIVDIYNGKAHKITEKIYHLIRGEIFDIQDIRFFVMGGAESHDKEFRKLGINYWQEELPSKEEYTNAINNLGKYNNEIDVIVTHCAPTSIQNIFGEKYKENILTEFLDSIKCNVKYKKWFFGHYHKNYSIDDVHHCLFENIIQIKL